MSGSRPRLAFFIDNCVPESAARAIEASGHSARRVRGSIPQDSPDELVAATAAAESEILVTHDKDFKAARRRAGVAESAKATVSLIHLSCRESEAALRLTAAMSLIEHEWIYAMDRGQRRVWIEVNTSLIRVNR